MLCQTPGDEDFQRRFRGELSKLFEATTARVSTNSMVEFQRLKKIRKWWISLKQNVKHTWTYMHISENDDWFVFFLSQHEICPPIYDNLNGKNDDKQEIQLQ